MTTSRTCSAATLLARLLDGGAFAEEVRGQQDRGSGQSLSAPSRVQPSERLA